MKAINRLFVGIVLMCLAYSANAQIAKWLVHPYYDYIEMTGNGLLKVVSDGKVGLLSVDGKEVLPIEFDSISSFKEDRALLFKDGGFYGITDLQGRIIPLQEKTINFYLELHVSIPVICSQSETKNFIL